MSKEEEEDLTIPPIFRCGIFKIEHQQPNGNILVQCFFCHSSHRLNGNIRLTSNFRQHIMVI